MWPISVSVNSKSVSSVALVSPSIIALDVVLGLRVTVLLPPAVILAPSATASAVMVTLPSLEAMVFAAWVKVPVPASIDIAPAASVDSPPERIRPAPASRVKAPLTLVVPRLVIALLV